MPTSSFAHKYPHMHKHIGSNAMPVGHALFFSLVIFGKGVSQTDSVHNPGGQLAIPQSACMCVFTQQAAAVSVIAL